MSRNSVKCCRKVFNYELGNVLNSLVYNDVCTGFIENVDMLLVAVI